MILKSRNHNISTAQQNRKIHILNNIFQSPQNQRFVQEAKKLNNYTFDGCFENSYNRNPLHMLNMSIQSSTLNANLISLTSLQQEDKYTREGYIISTIYWHDNNPIRNNQRYINPKMEEELRQFKDKIKARHSNAQIPKDFKFPRKEEEESNDFHSPQNVFQFEQFNSRNKLQEKYFSQSFYTTADGMRNHKQKRHIIQDKRQLSQKYNRGSFIVKNDIITDLQSQALNENETSPTQNIMPTPQTTKHNLQQQASRLVSHQFKFRYQRTPRNNGKLRITQMIENLQKKPSVNVPKSQERQSKLNTININKSFSRDRQVITKQDSPGAKTKMLQMKLKNIVKKKRQLEEMLLQQREGLIDEEILNITTSEGQQFKKKAMEEQRPSSSNSKQENNRNKFNMEINLPNTKQADLQQSPKTGMSIESVIIPDQSLNSLKKIELVNTQESRNTQQFPLSFTQSSYRSRRAVNMSAVGQNRSKFLTINKSRNIINLTFEKEQQQDSSQLSSVQVIKENKLNIYNKDYKKFVFPSMNYASKDLSQIITTGHNINTLQL